MNGYCCHGHLKTEENTYRRADGSENCKVCKNLAVREKDRKKRGIRAKFHKVKYHDIRGMNL